MGRKRKSSRQSTKDITRRITGYLGKKWWQGVAGLVGIVLVILTVVVILQSTDCGKQPELPQPPPSEEQLQTSQPSSSEEQPELISITDMGIDNALLDRLYSQAIAFAMDDYDDAELSNLSISIYPHQRYLNKCTIYFDFYSKWADRVCCYASDGETIEPCPLGADLSADSDFERVTFKELPWVQNPDWPRFVEKSSQKVGPLSVADMTHCLIWTSAYINGWVARFFDGKSGKSYSFTWDGKDDPIQL
jgi:hypothetical protein